MTTNPALVHFHTIDELYANLTDLSDALALAQADQLARRRRLAEWEDEQELLRARFIHEGLDGKNQAERDAALLMAMDAAPASVANRHEIDQLRVAIDDGSVEIGRLERAFKIDLAALRALGGQL